MYPDKKATYNWHIPVLMQVFFMFVQVYGLLFQHWSGLYVIYLYLAELILIFIFTIARFIQIRKKNGWAFMSKIPTLHRSERANKEHFKALIVLRILLLAFYVACVGFTMGNIERGDKEPAHNLQMFFENFMINDPLYWVALAALIFFYVKELFTAPDESAEGLITFSVNLETFDFRYVIFLCAPFVMPLVWMANTFLFEVQKMKDSNSSPLYHYAIALILLRFLIDMYLAVRISKEIKELHKEKQR